MDLLPRRWLVLNIFLLAVLGGSQAQSGSFSVPIKVQQPYGADRVMGDPMAAASVGAHLWANAAEAASRAEPHYVLGVLGGRSFVAPVGIVAVDDKTRHLWHGVRVAEAQPDGRMKVIWGSEFTLPPRPFPLRHTKEDWTLMAATLAQGGRQ